MELHRIAVRAVFAFLVLLILLRTSGKRTIAESTPFDFVLALIVGDMIDDLLWAEVAASAFVVATGTLFIVHTAVAWIASRSTAVAQLVNGRPTLMIHAGKPAPAGMRHERVADRELLSIVRAGGLPEDSVGDVREAWLETGGALSIVRHEQARPAQKKDLQRGGRR